MRNITLQSLELKNFKGIKDLAINFGQVTNISGENATGKTTIFDAFTWLLFDKDSQDRTTFEVKTLDSNNEALHGLDHTVTGTLDIDGRPWTLSKTYREKWTRRRGDTEKELTGHETLYEINQVPVSKKDYTDKVNEFLDGNLFKLLTNPLYFSLSATWKERRDILMKILGDISDEQVINYKSELEPLRAHLQDKNTDMLLKQVKATKSKLNDEIKAIPIRISEASNSIKDIAFGAVEMDLRRAEKKLAAIQESIRNNSADSEFKVKLREQIYQVKKQMQDIEHRIGMSNSAVKREWLTRREVGLQSIRDHNDRITALQRRIGALEAQAKGAEDTVNNLRAKYISTNSEAVTFPDHIKECPTCRRAFDEDDVEAKMSELKGNFNQAKAKKLEAITIEAKAAKEALAKYQKEIEENKQKLMEIQDFSPEGTVSEPEPEQVNYKTEPEYMELEKELADLEVKMYSNDKEAAVKELKEEEYQVKMEVNKLNGQLAYKEQNDAQRARIESLEVELRQKSQSHADMEKIEYLCELFIKTKVELLESSINEKFSAVSFKLFSTQVNGGISETCEALINGVPFSNANSAAQINAGLDIITSLSDYYQAAAPIFIDNRESVNEIIPVNSQVINLIVSKDKSLKVEVI